jgi:general secretion pathway protein C
MLLLALLSLAAAPPDLSAVGVIVSARPAAGVALLRSGGRTRAVAVGESAFGGRVVAVDTTKVVVEFGGVRVEVPLAGAATIRVAAAPQAPLAPAADDAPPPPRAMPRVDVEKRLAAEMQRILAETAVAPVSEDGRVVGLRLIRLAQGTLLTDVGLRTGDVLTSINGLPTDSLPALMALWPQLQGASDLRASVLRDGRSVSLSLGLH